VLESESDVSLGSSQEPKQLCDEFVLMVANFSDALLTVPKGTVLGVAQEISESLEVLVDQEESFDKGSEQVMLSGSGQKVRPKFRKYIASNLSHLSGEDRKVTEPVLLKYAELFHDDEDNDFISIEVVEHRIEIGAATLGRKVPYSIPSVLREEVDMHMQKMLDQGVIRPNNSPWQSPVILVPKKSESWKPKYRFCVDYRQVSAVTKFDSYPLPKV
jgi:hypothetical protein